MNAEVALITPTNKGLLSRLSGYVSLLGDADTQQIALFKTNVTIGPTTTLADLVEADFSGYGRVNMDENGPFIDATGIPYYDSNFQSFEHNGGATANTIYAVGLLVSSGGGVLAVATATQVGGHLTAITVGTHGSGYTAAPRVHIADAGAGSGGVAHAILSGDTVGSIVIDDAGAGYTTVTITLDGPTVLEGGWNLPTPRSMANNTDALNLISELTETTIGPS